MPITIRPLSVRTLLVVTILCAIASEGTFAAAKGAQGPAPPDRGSQNYERWLTREVGHPLIQVPCLSVFDNLQYSVNGSEVTLSGQVWQPVTKDDAETAVTGIEGVPRVINNIEVLPNNPMDDQVCRAEYRATYGAPELQCYATGVLPSIHIIAKNRHLTLVGTVDNEMDKNVVDIRAKSVPNVFSVDDLLQVRPARTQTQSKRYLLFAPQKAVLRAGFFGSLSLNFRSAGEHRFTRSTRTATQTWGLAVCGIAASSGLVWPQAR